MVPWSWVEGVEGRNICEHQRRNTMLQAWLRPGSQVTTQCSSDWSSSYWGLTIRLVKPDFTWNQIIYEINWRCRNSDKWAIKLTANCCSDALVELKIEDCSQALLKECNSKWAVACKTVRQLKFSIIVIIPIVCTWFYHVKHIYICKTNNIVSFVVRKIAGISSCGKF